MLSDSHHSSQSTAQSTVHGGQNVTHVPKDDKRASPKMVSLCGMFRFATWLDCVMMLIGALCAIANGAAMAAFSIILGDIFDVLNGVNPGKATQVSLWFVYIGFGTFVTAALQLGLWTAASERMTIKLRVRYLDALLAQDITFFDTQDSGTLTSKITENSLLFREALGEKFAAVFQFLRQVSHVGFFYLWQLCLVILALSPLLAFAGYFMSKTMKKVVSGQLESYAAAGSIAEETFGLIRTVTAFNLQQDRLKKFDKELDKAAKQSTRQGLSMGIGFGSVMFVYFCSYAIAFWVGSLLVVNSKSSAEAQHPMWDPPAEPFCVVGAQVPPICNTQSSTVYFETPADVCGCPFCRCGCYATSPNSTFINMESTCITGGDVLLTFFAVLIGSFAVGQSGPSITALTNGRIAAASLYDVIDRVPSIDSSSEEGFKLMNVKGDIEFTNVAFAYPTRLDMPVFRDLNLTIPGGKRVGLVGESGSGKSTCIALIERYYDPSHGSVSIDGFDLRTLNLKHLRSLIGLVAQEPILFGTSVRENVRFGLPDATNEEVELACRDANAHSFIQEFSDGYETFVTSSLVSGGQKQRLAIARALLRNPPILLFDEATAALDNESERLVNEAIDRLLLSPSSGSARTTIVIAHRLSSIRACEKIIVLENGKVVEEGSHEELLSTDGLYASLNKLSAGTGRLGGQKKETKKEMTTTFSSSSSSTDNVPKASMEGLLAIHNGHSNKPDVIDHKEEKPMTGTSTMIAVTTPESSPKFVGCCHRCKKRKRDPSEKTYPVRKAFRYAKQDKYYFIPAVLAAIANGVTFPVFALLFSNVTATFFNVNSSTILAQATRWCLAFFGLACGNALANFFQNFLFYFINGRMTKRVRSDVFMHILSLEMGFFDEKSNNVGVLTSKLASDAAMVRAAISDRLAVATMNVGTMIAGFIIAFSGSWLVSLVVFALFPAIVVAGAMHMLVMSGLANSDQKALEKAAHTLTESVSGIRTVVAFGMQSSVKKLYIEQLKGPLKLAMRKGVYGGFGFGFSQGVIFFAYALTFWYGSRLVANNTISFQNLTQSLFGIVMTAFALGQSTAMAPDLGKGQAAVNSIFRLLDRKSKINPFDAQGQQPSTIVGDISFEDIDFSYPTRPDMQILCKFNLKIERGQTVAFVGTSGSGKSTLALLVERLYDPKSGSVKIDGVDVRELNLKWLRNQIGIVFQEPVLFNGTIMENIRCGRIKSEHEGDLQVNPNNVDDEQVIEAAKMANAHEFIMQFPEGYQTNLQIASGVSGGQKQRIAIARALIRNPKILLLDEATSALDEESQKIVQQALDRLLQQSMRTTIVIAHRLSTIRNADVIVVLQNGIVVEQGSYEELASNPNGPFQSLLQAQEKIHGE